MRARIYTSHGTLGLIDLVDGACVADVVRAMREHRLHITPVEAPPEAVATTLPEDKTLEEQREGAYAEERQKRRRVRA